MRRLQTPPGTKFRVYGAQVRGGMILLTADTVDVLGGAVQGLIQAWQDAQRIQKRNKEVFLTDEAAVRESDDEQDDESSAVAPAEGGAASGGGGDELQKHVQAVYGGGGSGAPPFTAFSETNVAAARQYYQQRASALSVAGGGQRRWGGGLQTQYKELGHRLMPCELKCVLWC